MQVEIGRVAMVVTRLLEVDTVALHVNRKLLDEDAAAEFLPAFRFLELRQQRADVKKSERFPRQVRVRAEVSREVRLEMPRAEIQKLPRALEDFRRQRWR